MTNGQLKDEAVNSRPTRWPVAMSALMYPGLGQFVQKRWAAGAVFLVGFSACAIMFGVAAFRVLKAYYSLGFNFSTFETPDTSIAPLLVWFGISMFVYLANIFDAFLGYQRTCRQWAREKHGFQ